MASECPSGQHHELQSDKGKFRKGYDPTTRTENRNKMEQIEKATIQLLE